MSSFSENSLTQVELWRVLRELIILSQKCTTQQNSCEVPELYVDTLRQPWESDEHWQLRKEFIESYKNYYDEDRLLCLAQAYANVELLQCTYPDAVMKEVHELGKTLHAAHKLRETRQNTAGMRFLKPSEQNSADKKESETSVTFQRCEDCYPLICNNQNSSFVKLKSDFCEDTETPNANTRKDSDSNAICTSSSSNKRPWSEISHEHSSSSSSSDLLHKTTNPVSSVSAGFTKDVKKNELNINNEKTRILREIGKLVRNYMEKGYPSLEALENALQKLDEKPPVYKIAHKCALHMYGVKLAEVTTPFMKKSRLCAIENAVKLVTNPHAEVVSEKSSGWAVRVNPVSESSPQSVKDIKIKSSDSDYEQVFVLLDNTAVPREWPMQPFDILTQSANFSSTPFQMEYTTIYNDEEELCRCEVHVNFKCISEATGSTKEEARQTAAKIAINKLEKTSYTIKVKDEEANGIWISRNEVCNASCEIPGQDSPSAYTFPNQRKNKIRKKDFVIKLKYVLQKYANSDTTKDLIFSTEFSEEERKEIHKFATKFSLKCSRRGQGNSIYMVTSRKFSANELLNHLLDVGGSSNKYTLIPPNSGAIN